MSGSGFGWTLYYLVEVRPFAGLLLSETQFGFRSNEGFSTVDALKTVTDYIRKKTSVGQVVIAVSLDIRNAFNSLRVQFDWALEKKDFPVYVRSSTIIFSSV